MQIPMQKTDSESLLLSLLGCSMKQGLGLGSRTGPTSGCDSDLGLVTTKQAAGGPKPWV